MGFSTFLKVFHKVTEFAFLRFPFTTKTNRFTPFGNEKVPFNQHLIITKFDYSVRNAYLICPCSLFLLLLKILTKPVCLNINITVQSFKKEKGWTTPIDFVC